MKAIKNIEHYEMRDDLKSMWEKERTTILKTAAVVTGVVIVATAFFLGRHKILSALTNSKLYNAGMELSHKIADAASAVSHKVMDTAGSVANHFTERTGVSTLN